MAKTLSFLFIFVFFTYSWVFPTQEAFAQGFFPWKQRSITAKPSCRSDRDCVLVDVNCCGCKAGGKSTAIHKSLRKSYKKNLQARCSHPQRCLAWYRCDEVKAKCQDSQCVTIMQDIWAKAEQI